MKRGLLFVMGLAGALAMVPAAQAQTAMPTPKGFFFRVGMGAGSGKLTSDGGNSESKFGPSGNLVLGYAVRPNLVVALETNGFYKSFTDADLGDIKATSGVATVSAAVYPAAKVPAFVKAGVGLGVAEMKDAADNKVSSAGFGMTVGAGYDVRVGGVFLTPYVNFFKAFNGTAKSGGVDQGFKMGSQVIQGGLALTLY